MKKILFFAIALVASALVMTSCEKGNEPELTGTVYHYRGVSDVRHGTAYEHDVYISIEDNHKMTMKWVGVKTSEDAEPVTLYLYDGIWEDEGEGAYHIHCEALPQLPNGKPFEEWESFDIDGWCDATSCDFDYHINCTTGAIFVGKIVND